MAKTSNLLARVKCAPNWDEEASSSWEDVGGAASLMEKGRSTVGDPGQLPPSPAWAMIGAPWFRALPVIALVGAIALRWIWENLYNFAVKEDSVVEYLTALMYVVVVGLAVTIALHLGRTNRLAATAYILLAAAGVFIAGEEISWGQRIFGFAGPPELVEANYQGEANLHNLLGRHLLHGSYILVGLYGAFGRLLVPKIGWLRPAFLYAPSRWLATWFGTAAALYIYFDYIETPMASLFESYPVASQIGYDRLQEVVEFNLSVGFVLFVAYVLHRVRTAAPVQLRAESSGSS